MSAARAASRSAKSPCARGPGLSPRFRRRRHASSAWAAAQQRRGAGDVGVRAAARRAHVCARGGREAVRRGARSPCSSRARAAGRARVCPGRRVSGATAGLRPPCGLASSSRAAQRRLRARRSSGRPPRRARGRRSGWRDSGRAKPRARRVRVFSRMPGFPRPPRSRGTPPAARGGPSGPSAGGWIKGRATASSWLASRGLRAQPVEETGRGRAVLSPVPPPLGLPPDTLGAHTAAAVTQWRPFGAGGELRCSATLTPADIGLVEGLLL